MTAAIEGLGLAFRILPSGAGHDTVHMARLGPVGMIFVPSADGRSHCPEEWTAPEHVEAGASALLATMLALDAR
jgi:N-carbamoyl-L-amino-acid hydrolase